MLNWETSKCLNCPGCFLVAQVPVKVTRNLNSRFIVIFHGSSQYLTCAALLEVTFLMLPEC